MLRNFKQLQRSLTPHTVPQRADDEKGSPVCPSPPRPTPLSWRDVLIKSPFRLFHLVQFLTECLIAIDSHHNGIFHTQRLKTPPPSLHGGIKRNQAWFEAMLAILFSFSSPASLLPVEFLVSKVSRHVTSSSPDHMENNFKISFWDFWEKNLPSPVLETQPFRLFYLLFKGSLVTTTTRRSCFVWSPRW